MALSSQTKKDCSSVHKDVSITPFQCVDVRTETTWGLSFRCHIVPKAIITNNQPTSKRYGMVG
eukprot:scaffold5357_cov208-Amphora_coffeaeformis.AAC.5